MFAKQYSLHPGKVYLKLCGDERQIRMENSRSLGEFE
jgi:hypothetical protein